MAGKDLRHAKTCVSGPKTVYARLRPFFDEKSIYKDKIWWGKTRDMHKGAFQALKHPFTHISGLLAPIIEKKILKLFLFFLNQKMVEEDVRHGEK